MEVRWDVFYFLSSESVTPPVDAWFCREQCLCHLTVGSLQAQDSPLSYFLPFPLFSLQSSIIYWLSQEYLQKYKFDNAKSFHPLSKSNLILFELPAMCSPNTILYAILFPLLGQVLDVMGFTRWSLHVYPLSSLLYKLISLYPTFYIPSDSESRIHLMSLCICHVGLGWLFIAFGFDVVWGRTVPSYFQ